jgi:hypothetical protein
LDDRGGDKITQTQSQRDKWCNVGYLSCSRNWFERHAFVLVVSNHEVQVFDFVTLFYSI